MDVMAYEVGVITLTPTAAPWSEWSQYVDACITDPPYGGRTHSGHDAGGPQILSATGQATRRALSYAPWTEDDVSAFVDHMVPLVRGWFVAFTSHDLIDAYMRAYARHGRYAFAPVTIVQKRPRLLGDGPASWTLYLMVSRPKSREWQKWRCLPGSYASGVERGAPIVGSKPVKLLTDIVRDYTDAGHDVGDPCAGWGSTLIAAHRSGLRAFGSDQDTAIFGALSERVSQELGRA